MQAIRTPRLDRASSIHEPASPRRIFRDGFLVASLYPKTAVFFAAFLPQFMNAEAPAIVESVPLGSVFVAIAAVTDTAYAMAAGALAPVLSRARGVRALGRYVPGGVLHRPRRLHGGP
jgi:threonine/homoserine/homoserine lactone efflux protein